MTGGAQLRAKRDGTDPSDVYSSMEESRALRAPRVVSASGESDDTVSSIDRAQAVDDMFREHAEDIYRYAVVLTRDRDAADDITASTFERALRAWRPGSIPAGPALPWLLTIARRLAMDRWRATKRRLASRLTAGTGVEGPDFAGTQAWLDALASALPGRQREVVVLRYFADLDDRHIALLMGLSESGVRSLVARALSNLRSHPEVWS